MTDSIYRKKKAVTDQLPRFHPTEQHFGQSIVGNRSDPFEGISLTELVAVARRLDPCKKLESITFVDLLKHLSALCRTESKGNRYDPTRSELLELGICTVLLKILQISMEEEKTVTEKIVSLTCECIAYLSRNNDVLEELMNDMAKDGVAEPGVSSEETRHTAMDPTGRTDDPKC